MTAHKRKVLRLMVSYGMTRQQAEDHIACMAVKRFQMETTKATIETFYSQTLKRSVTVPSS